MASCGAFALGRHGGDLPEKHGKWLTIYQRFRRWSEAGIWIAVATARPGLDWAAFHFNPPGEIQLY